MPPLWQAWNINDQKIVPGTRGASNLQKLWEEGRRDIPKYFVRTAAVLGSGLGFLSLWSNGVGFGQFLAVVLRPSEVGSIDQKVKATQI